MLMTRGAVILRHFSSMRRRNDWLNVQQIIFTNKLIIVKKISVETLSEEFKPVVLVNCEGKIWQNKNINWTFSHVQPFNIPI